MRKSLILVTAERAPQMELRGDDFVIALPLGGDDGWRDDFQAETLVVDATLWQDHTPRDMMDYLLQWWNPPDPARPAAPRAARPNLLLLLGEGVELEAGDRQDIAQRWGQRVRVEVDAHAVWRSLLPDPNDKGPETPPAPAASTPAPPPAPAPPKPLPVTPVPVQAAPVRPAQALVEGPPRELSTVPQGRRRPEVTGPALPPQGTLLVWSEQGGVGVTTMARSMAHVLHPHIPVSENPYRVLVISLDETEPLLLRAGRNLRPNVAHWATDIPPRNPLKLEQAAQSDTVPGIGLVGGFETLMERRRLLSDFLHHASAAVDIARRVADWVIFDAPPDTAHTLLPLVDAHLILTNANRDGEWAATGMGDFINRHCPRTPLLWGLLCPQGEKDGTEFVLRLQKLLKSNTEARHPLVRITPVLVPCHARISLAHESRHLPVVAFPQLKQCCEELRHALIRALVAPTPVPAASGVGIGGEVLV